jgi:AsmA-like C-terminal region
VASLSRHARGHPESGAGGTVLTALTGRFVLANGIIALHGLRFHVPGATIALNGTYGLVTERLDFRGTATMEAKLSEMTTGVKSFLLKALDPIFRTNKAGARIPIHITGTRDHPSIGLDLKGL